MIALVAALLVQADLVDKLRADDVAVRDAAEQALVKLGEAALPALKKALEAEKEAEPKARLEKVIATLEQPRRYGRGSSDWRVRIEDAGSYVELRGDGTGIMVASKAGYVLAPTRRELDWIALRALEAEILDREYKQKLVDFDTDSRYTLVFESGREQRRVVVDLRSTGSPAVLKQLVRELSCVFANPDTYQGRSVETLIEEFAGPDAEAAREAARALRSTAWGVERFLRDPKRPFDMRERLKALLVQDPADLIEKLRSDDVAVRDAAERELVKLGEAALPALQKALEREKEAEARARLASVLAKIEKPLRYATTSRAWVLNAEKRISDVTILLRVTGAGDAWKVCNGSWIRRVTLPRALIDDLHALALDADLLDRHDARMASDRKMVLGIELATAAGRGQWEFDLVKPPGALEQKMMELVERAAESPSDDVIALLSSPEIDKRDAAERDLVKLGEVALPELRRVLLSEKEAEARARLASVVAKIEKPMRYGRGKATWRMRLTFDVQQPEPRSWFVDITGDGTGVVAPWGREVRAFALAPTREQLDEAVELAIGADVLDGDFAAVESEAKMPPGAASVLRFENGSHVRTIHVRAPRDTIPEGLRKLLYFLQGPLADPSKMKGREAGELAADLRGPSAEAAERSIRRMGSAAIPALKRALGAELEESVKTRIEKLLDELTK